MVTEREQLSARGRLAAENVLRDEPVDGDDDGVARREDIRGRDCRLAAHVPGDDEQRDEKDRLLPRRGDVEPRSAHAELPQLRHGDVVQGEPHDQDADRDRYEATGANRRSPPASCRG